MKQHRRQLMPQPEHAVCCLSAQFMIVHMSGQADTGSSSGRAEKGTFAPVERSGGGRWWQRTGGEMWWQRPCLATSEKRRAFVAGAALTLATKHARAHTHRRQQMMERCDT